MYRDTFVEIDQNIISDNITKIVAKYNDYDYYIGVVKGNAYGHGFGIINTMIDSGINYLAVSSLDEAMEVRGINRDIPVLILEPVDLKYIDVCERNNITITISSFTYFQELISLNPNNLLVHIKLNTGFNRLGISNTDEFEIIYDALIDNKNIQLEGLYTHFATTGITDKMYDNQVRRFKEMTKKIDPFKVKVIHLGRSSSIELHPKIDIANGVRLGLIMYGINQTFRTYSGLKGKLKKIRDNYLIMKFDISSVYQTNGIQVDTAITLKSKIIEINKIKKGEVVGYGATYIASQDTYIAVCPVGYADGLDLRYKNSKVSIRGKLFNIVGIINMCMITIEVDKYVEIDDEVIVVGAPINIKKTATLLGSTPYIVMTGINPKLPRVYKENTSNEFEVVMIGSDINAYYMARNFHEEYGIKSHIIGKTAMNFTSLSTICDVFIEPNLWDYEVFRKRLKDIALKYKGKKIILLGTNDTYVRMIVENRNYLSEWYIFNYIDVELLDRLLIKEKFYTTFADYDIGIPRTFFYDCKERNFDINEIEKLEFPIVIKPSNSVKWHDHEFPGQAKVYKAETITEVTKIISDVETAGYDDKLILQEFIAGDDSCLFDSIFYCSTDGVPRLQTFAQIGLQERTPTGVGNCTVLINGFNEYNNTDTIKDKLKDLLADIKYRGIAEFDLKYDPNREKFYVLEINPRQARSSYYLTQAGYNLARYLVDDLIYGKKPDFHFIDDEVMLSFVPKYVIKKYIDNPVYKAKALEMINKGKMDRVLNYKGDRNKKRKLWLAARDLNYGKKYKNSKW